MSKPRYPYVVTKLKSGDVSPENYGQMLESAVRHTWDAVDSSDGSGLGNAARAIYWHAVHWQDAAGHPSQVLAYRALRSVMRANAGLPTEPPDDTTAGRMRTLLDRAALGLRGEN